MNEVSHHHNKHDMMFEAHIDISEDVKVSGFEKILDNIKAVLSHYSIYHSTIQPEFTVDDNKQIIH